MQNQLQAHNNVQQIAHTQSKHFLSLFSVAIKINYRGKIVGNNLD